MEEESDSGPGLRLQRKLLERNCRYIRRNGNPGSKRRMQEHRVAGEIHGLILLTDLLNRIGRSSRFFLDRNRNGVNGVSIRISREEESWGEREGRCQGRLHLEQLRV